MYPGQAEKSVPNAAKRRASPKIIVEVATPAKYLICLGPTFVRNSSEAAGVNVRTEGPITDKKNTTAPIQPIADAMWRKVRIAMTVGSAIIVMVTSPAR